MKLLFNLMRVASMTQRVVLATASATLIVAGLVEYFKNRR